jgi:hypothetical protein
MTARTQPNRLGQYADVRPILDEALASGGGRYTLPTHGEAVNWRHRAYRFRKLFATLYGEGKESPYDRVSMRKLGPDDCTVVLTITQVRGVFEPTGEDAPAIDDELLDFAKGLAKQIEGET